MFYPCCHRIRDEASPGCAVALFHAGAQFEVLGTNKLDADNMRLPTPALAGDRLLIRSAGRLCCIRNAP